MAFSLKSVTKVPLKIIGGICGIFLFPRKLFNIDQYVFGISEGSFSFFPNLSKYASFDEDTMSL